MGLDIARGQQQPMVVPAPFIGPGWLRGGDRSDVELFVRSPPPRGLSWFSVWGARLDIVIVIVIIVIVIVIAIVIVVVIVITSAVGVAARVCRQRG